MASFVKRQEVFSGPGYQFNTWWYSTAGTIVRYVLSGAVLVFFVFFVCGGYLHARLRMKKGREPLAYHRWMVSNETRRQYGLEPRFVQRRFGNSGQGPLYGVYPQRSENVEHFNMNNWNYAPPPPAYNVPHQPPPDYYPEPTKGDVGATVTAEARPVGGGESSSGRAPEYEAPVGPPPPPQAYGGAVYR